MLGSGKSDEPDRLILPQSDAENPHRNRNSVIVGSRVNGRCRRDASGLGSKLNVCTGIRRSWLMLNRSNHRGTRFAFPRDVKFLGGYRETYTLRSNARSDAIGGRGDAHGAGR